MLSTNEVAAGSAVDVVAGQEVLYQTVLTGTGAVSATVVMERSNTGADWHAIKTDHVSGADSVTVTSRFTSPDNKIRARCTAISGTGAEVAVDQIVGPAAVTFPGGVTLAGDVIADLPTADPEVVNQLWSDAGTVKVSAGPGE
jgi:hypothetical protein